MDRSTFFRIILDGYLIPQTPGKITWTVQGNNETWQSAKGGTFVTPHKSGVREFNVDFTITRESYPYQFTVADGVNPDWVGYNGGQFFFDYLKDKMDSRTAVDVIIDRDKDARLYFQGSFYISDFTALEDAENESDIVFTINFQEAVIPINQELHEGIQHHLIRVREAEGWKSARYRTGEENEVASRLAQEGSGVRPDQAEGTPDFSKITDAEKRYIEECIGGGWHWGEPLKSMPVEFDYNAQSLDVRAALYEFMLLADPERAAREKEQLGG